MGFRLRIPLAHKFSEEKRLKAEQEQVFEERSTISNWTSHVANAAHFAGSQSRGWLVLSCTGAIEIPVSVSVAVLLFRLLPLSPADG